jgi:HD superfamily phosphohydrolase YqeK
VVAGGQDRLDHPRKVANLAILEGEPYAVDPTKAEDAPVWGSARGCCLSS